MPKAKKKEVETKAGVDGDGGAEKRITPEDEGVASAPAAPATTDYLRQFQYRKRTKPGSKQSDPAPGSKAELMKERLLKQDKVRVYIPRQNNEGRNVKLSVNLNGYRLDLPKQTYVEVPKQVAEVIIESQRQTDDAIERMQILPESDKEKALN